MSNLLDKTSSNFARNLRNVEVALKIHALTTLTIFVVFFIFGIKPLFGALKTRYLLLKEMQSDYTVLQGNLTKLQKAESDIRKYENYFTYLDKFMPEKTNTQTYMLDFIKAAGASGYTVERFSQDEVANDNGQLNITLVLTGTGYPTELLKQIEELKRVTQVINMRMIRDSDGQIKIDLVITIFTIIK